MHTKDNLAAVLREAGLFEMADKAATGYYHDYLSPLAFPERQLSNDLLDAAGVARDFGNEKMVEAALAIRERHHNGEFDASTEESDDWARSPEGQAAFRQLLGDRHQ